MTVPCSQYGETCVARRTGLTRSYGTGSCSSGGLDLYGGREVRDLVHRLTPETVTVDGHGTSPREEDDLGELTESSVVSIVLVVRSIRSSLGF